MGHTETRGIDYREWGRSLDFLGVAPEYRLPEYHKRSVLLIRHPAPDTARALDLANQAQTAQETKRSGNSFSQSEQRLINQLTTRGEDGQIEWDPFEDWEKIDKTKGIPQLEKLFQYFPDLLNTYLVREDDQSGRLLYTIISSPLPRCRVLAELLRLSLKRSHADNPFIPLPVGLIQKDAHERIAIDRHFVEVPIARSIAQIQELFTKQQKTGMDPKAIWYGQDLKKNIAIFEAARKRVQAGLEFLKEYSTPATFIVTHRALIGFVNYLIAEDKLSCEVTEKDLLTIMEYESKIAYTSLSTISYSSSNWRLDAQGVTPHLDDHPDLIGGKMSL